MGLQQGQTASGAATGGGGDEDGGGGSDRGASDRGAGGGRGTCPEQVRGVSRLAWCPAVAAGDQAHDALVSCRAYFFTGRIKDMDGPLPRVSPEDRTRISGMTKEEFLADCLIVAKQENASASRFF